MMAVIDTNVLLVANGQHKDVSTDCVIACVHRLREMEKTGVTIIDDGFRILNEYQNKTRLHPPKGVGDVFLKSLLRNVYNQAHVQLVSISETDNDCFAEFPDPVLQPRFDAPDRKFAAVANAHPAKPPVWQAADCKWLGWWSALQEKGVHVEFLCKKDVDRFYRSKFPDQELPAFPSILT